jgi:hypothetical protein
VLWFYESFFPVLWIVFLIYWQIKAVDTKTTRRLEPVASRILRVLTFVIAIVAKPASQLRKGTFFRHREHRRFRLTSYPSTRNTQVKCLPNKVGNGLNCCRVLWTC